MRTDATNQTAVPTGPTDISLIEILNAVLRNWRALVILPFVFAVLVGISTLTKTRSYYATSSFVAQTAENRGLSGAAALAQQFGVNLGSERAGQSPQFYEDLLRTRTILRRAVESEYEFPAPTGQMQKGTLIQYWRLDELQSSDPAWRVAMDRLRGTISTSVRRETGVIELRVTLDRPAVAEQVAARLLDLLNDYNLEVRQTRARDESRFISGRLAEAQRELRTLEDALEAFLRQNRGDFRNSPELTFQHDRLQRQVLAGQEVYTSLLRGQEQARIDAMRDTPVLQVIDSPLGTATPSPRKTALRTLLAFMMGVMLAVAIAAIRETGRRGRMSNDPEYLEFQDLVRRIWNDVRNPRRWIARREKHVAVGRD